MDLYLVSSWHEQKLNISLKHCGHESEKGPPFLVFRAFFIPSLGLKTLFFSRLAYQSKRYDADLHIKLSHTN